MKRKLEDYVNEKFENKQISDMDLSDDDSKEVPIENVSRFNSVALGSLEDRLPDPRRIHLDPRIAGSNRINDSNKKIALENQMDLKSNQSSYVSPKTPISQSSTTSASSIQKRKKETNKIDYFVEKKLPDKDQDPFEFLSKLINKPTNGNDSVPCESTTGESNNNLSFLMSSLQKFVNSGSNSSKNISDYYRCKLLDSLNFYLDYC